MESRTGVIEPSAGLGAGEPIGEYATYPEAQEVVDRLSDAGFPVERVRIIGTGMYSLEQVTGRLTKGRAALAGAASGAWFGLLIGLLFSLFAIGATWLAVLAGSLLIGAVWGALFGFLAHWASRGRRDFSSVSAVRARQYLVQVDVGHAAEAARLLGSR